MNTLSTKEYTRQRREKSKATLKLVSSLLKKDGWNKCQYMLWQVVDDLFWTVRISTHLNSDTTSIDIAVKPLSIDPVLWDVMGLSENKAEPLSFRALGVFTCPSLPMEQMVFLNDVALASLEHDIQRWVNSRLMQLANAVANKSFSTLYTQHVNQIERHAYAIPILCTLVAERQFAAAHAVALKYTSGATHTVFNFTTNGVSFFELALAYLQGNASDVRQPPLLTSKK